jgi:hypothetical protein
VKALDTPAAELNEVELKAEALWGVERCPVVGSDGEVESAGKNSLPDVDDGFGRRGKIQVLGLLGRGVSNARCTANEYELAAEFGSDEAGG